jgi:transposase InsO family protein
VMLTMSSCNLEDDLFDEGPVIESCILGGENPYLVRAMIDNGCTGYSFVNSAIVRRICEALNISPVKLNKPRKVKGYDGRMGDPITHAIYPRMTIRDHAESSTPLLITKLGQHDVILGKPWMRKHGVSYHGHSDDISFLPGHCSHLGAPGRSFPILPTQIKEILQESRKEKDDFKPTRILKRNENIEQELVKAPETKKLIETKTETKDSTETSISSKKKKRRRKRSRRIKPIMNESTDSEIYMIGAAPFHLLTKQKGAEIFALSPREIDAQINAASSQDIDIQLSKTEKIPTDPKTVVPLEYHDFLDVFSKQEADKLPPHRDGHDHRIELEEGKEKSGHGYAPLYRMSDGELLLVKQYLEEHLDKGFIKPSSASYSSPVLFVRKPGGGLRFCVDYRKLNAITKKNRYPLPLISEIIARLTKAQLITKIDIRHAFNRIRMATERDEELTTFTTKYGNYQYRVLPFGLTGGPATFQQFVNDNFLDFLDEFLVAYLDDLVIYSDNLQDHQKHVKKVLQRLREIGLQADIDKCEFHVFETKFLGLIVGRDGVRMDPAKIQAIVEWATPRHLKEVQAFLGFINFYRRFIEGFSKLAKPLVNLTKKEQIFDWSPACEKAFNDMKKKVTEAPVLAFFRPDLETFVECDSSDYVSAGVHSQRGEDGIIRPVAYFSKTLSPAECNYEIYDKELLAIIRCFEEWRAELQSVISPVKVLTDHKSLEYFMTTKKLNRRQGRWAEFLADYDFKITYQPGKIHDKADALTRRPGDKPSDENDARNKHMHQTLLPANRLDDKLNGSLINDLEEVEPQLFERAMKLNQEDAFCINMKKAIKDKRHSHKQWSLKKFEIAEDTLLFRKKLWIPDNNELRLNILKEIHDQPAVGHPGIRRTWDLVKRHFYWPRMRELVDRYVRNCHLCRRSKAPRDRYSGLLNPLSIPDRPWTDISMDFVTGLPLSMNGLYNAILMVVCRLSKMHHYIPCFSGDDGTSAEETAKMLLTHVWKVHGLPTTIISDRGPQFVALTWKSLCQSLRIKAKLSTAFHPETDGQSEIANQEMERYLRSYCDYQQSNWAEWLPMAEYASNATISASTGISAFMANYGFEPRMSFDPIEPPESGSARERILRTKGVDMAKKMKEVFEFTRRKLAMTQESQKKHADKKRVAAPDYKEGDFVWLSTRNIRTTRPSKKLDWKMIGPYKVKKVLGASCQLELPSSMTIHDTFHTSLLRKASDDPLPGQIADPPPPIVIDQEEEFELDDVLDSRRVGRNKKLQYKVSWKGYPPDPTWYPAENFENSKEVVADFHGKFPTKPR